VGESYIRVSRTLFAFAFNERGPIFNLEFRWSSWVLPRGLYFRVFFWRKSWEFDRCS